MFERFTLAARTAVVRAQQEAREQGSATIGAEHLLFGVLTDAGSAPAVVLGRWGVDAARVSAANRSAGDLDDQALSALGIDLAEVRRRAEAAFGPGALDEPHRLPRLRRMTMGHLPFTVAAKGVLGQAVRLAAAARDGEIGSAQLFLGLVTDPGVLLTLRGLGVDATPAELVRLVRTALDEAA